MKKYILLLLLFLFQAEVIAGCNSEMVLSIMRPIENLACSKAIDDSILESTGGYAGNIYCDQKGLISAVELINYGEMGAISSRIRVIDQSNFLLRLTTTSYKENINIQNNPVIDDITDNTIYVCDGKIWKSTLPNIERAKALVKKSKILLKDLNCHHKQPPLNSCKTHFLDSDEPSDNSQSMLDMTDSSARENSLLIKIQENILLSSQLNNINELNAEISKWRSDIAKYCEEQYQEGSARFLEQYSCMNNYQTQLIKVLNDRLHLYPLSALCLQM